MSPKTKRNPISVFTISVNVKNSKQQKRNCIFLFYLQPIHHINWLTKQLQFTYFSNQWILQFCQIWSKAQFLWRHLTSKLLTEAHGQRDRAPSSSVLTTWTISEATSTPVVCLVVNDLVALSEAKWRFHFFVQSLSLRTCSFVSHITFQNSLCGWPIIFSLKFCSRCSVERLLCKENSIFHDKILHFPP